jgi:hypothetical protein
MEITVSTCPVYEPGRVTQDTFEDFDDLAAALHGALQPYEAKDQAPLLVPVAEWSTPYRKKENVRTMARVFVADFDDLSDEQADETLAALKGLSCVLYTTWGSKPGHCFRAVIELDRAYPVAEHAHVFATMQSLVPHIDPACKNPDRGYYMPVVRPGREDDAFVESWAGQPVRLTELETAPPAAVLEVRAADPEIVATALEAWTRQRTDTTKKLYARWALALLQDAPKARQVPAGKGQRYKFLVGLAGYLARSFPLTDGIPELFDTAAWEVYVNPDGKYPVEWLARRLGDFQDKERERLEEAAAEKAERIRQQILSATGGERETQCTEEEWNALQAAFAGRAQKHLVLQFDRLFFFLRPDGTYDGGRAWKQNELVAAMRDAFAVWPEPIVEWWYEGSDGRVRVKNERKLREDYSTAARHMVFDVTADRTYYKDGELIVASAKPVVGAVYHTDIQEFILRAGGELLVDACAGLQRLDYPMPVLVMTGAPRTGKTLLAHGHSAVRGGHHMKLEQIAGDHGRFNIELRNNPFLVQDEAAGEVYRRQGTSILREGTITNERYLEQKHVDRVKMRGYVRYIFCANNPHILDTAEGMNADDRAAFAERILHVHFPDEMQAYCDAIQPKIEAEWLKQGRLAEHLLWLGHNWDIKHGGERFLVRGPRTDLHEGLAGGGGGTGDMLYFLLSYLAKPKLAPLLPAEVRDGRLRVHAASIAKQWRKYCESYPPSPNSVTKAVQSIAANRRQRMQFKGKDYNVYQIDVDELRAGNRRFNLLTDDEFSSIFDK